jgi:Outer membrane protein beta-barrel domain
MKAIYILASLCLFTMAGKAQQTKDTVAKSSNKDTIRIGSIMIIRNGKSKSNNDSTLGNNQVVRVKKNKKISTNYIIVDAGFANWTDNTNYTPTPSGIINRPGTAAFSASDMKLRSGKSANVNIWLFMQKVSLYKSNFNLKYGLGFEFNNYSFRSPVSFKESGILPNGTGASTVTPFVFRDSISFSKNKLNLKYLTVPLMLNVATTKKKGMPKLSASVGMSAGYLIRERNKQNSSERGRQKNQGDYDMQKFKLSYIAELGLGPVRLYGSYSPKSIFENGLDIRPYAVGIRFSNW